MLLIQQFFSLFIWCFDSLGLFERAQLLLLVEWQELLVIEQIEALDVDQPVNARFNQQVELFVLGP